MSKTKTETVQCRSCNGQGYKFDNYNWSDNTMCEFNVGCDSCGGSGRKAVGGMCSKEEQRESMKKGSGKQEVTYTWDERANAWKEVSRKAKTGWL